MIEHENERLEWFTDGYGDQSPAESTPAQFLSSEEVRDGDRKKIRPPARALHRLCTGTVPVDHAHGPRCGGGFLSSCWLLVCGSGLAALGDLRSSSGAPHSKLRDSSPSRCPQQGGSTRTPVGLWDRRWGSL